MAAKIEPKPLDRPLWVIAHEILADHRANRKSISQYAEPYIEAMVKLDKLTDMYYAERADMIVAYLLGNLREWRGETARRIKEELRAALAHHGGNR